MTGANSWSIGIALPVSRRANSERLSGHSVSSIPTCGLSVGSLTTQFQGSWSGLTPFGGAPWVHTTGPEARGRPSWLTSITGAQP
jgi:hypothetical protein